jgi:thioredoxin-related protein
MRLILSVLLLVSVGHTAGAQTGGPEVDQAEVLRLGNMVQVVGDGPRATPDTDAYVAAMGPPASDADKWFISVLSMKGCAGCEKLRKDWAANPWLLALANPTDPKQSWAHYTVYDKDDRSQAFRFENIQVTAYPTILVQPPRSGRYGDASTVVYQGVYGGDPEKLARDVTQAIRQYVTKLHSAPARGGEHGQVGVDPPWQPVPKVEPRQPQPNRPFPPFDPTIPPQPPAPAPAFPWSAVFSLVLAGFSAPAAVALVIWAVSYIRARRQAEGKPPIVDQPTLDRVLQLLQQLAENQPKQPTPKT